MEDEELKEEDIGTVKVAPKNQLPQSKFAENRVTLSSTINQQNVEFYKKKINTSLADFIKKQLIHDSTEEAG